MTYRIILFAQYRAIVIERIIPLYQLVYIVGDKGRTEALPGLCHNRGILRELTDEGNFAVGMSIV